MKFSTDPKTGATTGWCEVVTSRNLVLTPGANLDALLAAASAALAPAPPARIEKWLAELAYLANFATPRNSSSDDLAFTIAAFTTQLAAYPGDCVRAVLMERGRTRTWWPAFAELHEKLEPLVEKRRLFRYEIEAEIRRRRAPAPATLISPPAQNPDAPPVGASPEDADEWRSNVTVLAALWAVTPTDRDIAAIDRAIDRKNEIRRKYLQRAN